jgi:hypothetical protein
MSHEHSPSARLPSVAQPVPALRFSSDPTVLNPELLAAKHAEHENEVLAVKRMFWWFSVVASTNHALNYVVTSFATSVLDTQLGGIILGLSWTLNAVSGMTVATPCVRRLGFKYSMIVALWGYTIQIGSLYLAMVAADPKGAWAIAITGSVVSGFTSAIWWTAQGVAFEGYCQKINEICSNSAYDKDVLIGDIR